MLWPPSPIPMFANGTVTKSPLFILAFAMVLIAKPFWTENISRSASVPKILVIAPCSCFQGKLWAAVVSSLWNHVHAIGHQWGLSSAKFWCLAFCAFRRLSRKFPCTDVSRRPSVTASSFGERVKKCMNHVRDSLVGNFSHVSLSACLTKSFFSVCSLPSLASPWLPLICNKSPSHQNLR